MTHEPKSSAPYAVDYTKMFDLTGQRAVVVGAGSGIGRESAIALAAGGAEVICADRNLIAAKDTASRGPGMSAYELDATSSVDVEGAVAEIGAVDTLVVTAATNVRKRILDYSSEEFERVIALNLRAQFDLFRGFGRGMAERGKGSIIGFSSMRATLVEPGQSVYATTKGGLVQLLRTIAAELGPQGVRANAIAPGAVDTALTVPIRSNKEWDEAYATKGALDRWAHPSELAGAVVFLASPAASFITGSQLCVDGGWTAVDGRYTPPMG
ncbi:SDR family NAD(P)-dependent oxidoreductase [Streptomyces dysideae]|uniref:3-oxoacyl-ACP reductase n=1 Tax=Streptomyces dysideae TaxID=909626 RepID=A0A101UT72_9ACTN|nr:SDR family oxidoreductase [Streptomyces dysideae]KUO16411.1 3-oxoacyl-ACP reductase [Streptomyces dysideae]